MTKKSPRIYLYKITFEEVPFYYYGVKKEKYYNQKYFGSPITHKWVWDFYTPKKQILEFFEYSDEGWLKAQEIEKRLIAPVLNDELCLNENVGGSMSISTVKKVGQNHFKNGTAVFSLSKEERIELSKQIVKKNRENKVGIFAMSKEEKLAAAKKGGQKSFETKTGIFSLTPEELSKNGKKTQKLGIGIFSQTKEQLIKNGKKSAKIINSQRWECCETGYVSTSAGLSVYQKARGIDTSKRKRIK